MPQDQLEGAQSIVSHCSRLTLRLFRPPPAAASTLFFTLLRMLNTSLTFTSACTEHAGNNFAKMQKIWSGESLLATGKRKDTDLLLG